MKSYNRLIQHDGGTHNVDVELDGGHAIISFGASFTLRLDEANIDKLRHLLYDASCALMNKCEDTTDLNEDLTGKKFSVSEDDFVQAGIDARENLKTISRNERMMKGTAYAADWNPNDPSNW